MEKNNIRIDDMGLSRRVVYALKNFGINTLEEMLEYHHKYNLIRVRNLGEVGLKEIENILLSKYNIKLNKDISELENLNLSNSALNVLVNKFKISTMKELLAISLYKRDYRYLNSELKSEKEIIDKVHSLGYIFECEKEEDITLDTKLYTTPIYNISRRISWMSIGELLKLSLDPNEINSLYRQRDIGVVKAKKIIDIIHSYGFVFECEKEENKEEVREVEEVKKKLTVNDSIDDLGYYSGLTRNMKYYGINTIEDLLKLSTNEYISHEERGIYNIRGFGKKKVLHLIEYVHSLGFVFEDEKALLNKNNTLENLYRTFDDEFISREFYEKIEVPNDFVDNSFVLYFSKIASGMCVDEFGRKYINREIILFLGEKLIEHKKKMLDISNSIKKKLELKK